MDVFGRKMSNWNVLSVETALQQLNTFEEDFITRSNTVNYQGTESLIIITILNKLIILILILFFIFVITVLVKKIAK